MEERRISELPPTVYYLPNFVSEEEETFLTRKIYTAPKTKWTNLLNRRLQNWGGTPQEKGMIKEPMPDWLQTQIDKIDALGIFGSDKKPNHVLVNEYKPGEGISPHLDGSLFHPTIATISLGSHTVLNFYEPLSDENISGDEPCKSFEDRLKFKLYVAPRSLILIKDSMFHHYLHGIEEKTKDFKDGLVFAASEDHEKLGDGEIIERQTRISLTIRHVPKTKSIKIRL